MCFRQLIGTSYKSGLVNVNKNLLDTTRAVVYCSDMAKNPHAVALGRKGGKKGGKARWAGVMPEQRSEVLRKAVQARWAKAKRTKP